jgi:chromate reductase, NAD(P)H dehydrogenase (quinone)
VKLLALSGSLRAASSHTALLEAARRLAPTGVEIDLWLGLANLPHFNPDLDEDDEARLPAAVRELRRLVGSADGLLLSTPEYAHGLPGSFKNALDWLVGSTEFPGKIVAVISPSARSVHAPEQLREILSTMSARFTEPWSFVIQLPRRDMNVDNIIADSIATTALRAALMTIATTLRTGAAP